MKEGLQFGLCLEPEMISVDSDLYQNILTRVIQVLVKGAYLFSESISTQSFANPSGRILENVLDQLPSYHEIDYIKWDMNRNMTNLGNGSLLYLETKMQSHQYMLGF